MSSKRGASGLSKSKAQSNDGAKEKPVIDFTNMLWIKGVVGFLRSAAYIVKDGDFASEPIVVQAIEMFEIQCNKMARDYDSPTDALTAFRDWLADTDWHYEEPVTHVITGLHFTITMSVPAGTIAVTADYVVGADEVAALRGVKDELQALVVAAFGKNKEMPRLDSGKSTQSQAPETEENHASILRAKDFQGKLTFQVIPDDGKWQKYGYPLYKDVAKQYEIELPDEEGEYDIDWNVTCELKDDGKPKRVSHIEEQ